MRRRIAISIGLTSSRTFLGGLFGNSKSNPDPKNFVDPAKIQEMMRNMTPEQRVESMKRVIELQKRMVNIPGVGSLVSKNVEMLEGLLKEINKSSPDVASGTTPQKSEQLRGSGPTLDELRKVSLGPEIDALFAELASMRAKRNEYRAKFEETEEQNKVLQNSLATQTSSAAELRDRLRLAEKTVALLNAEVATLTEKNSSIKALRSQLQEAQNKLVIQQSERNPEEQLKQALAASQANVVSLTKTNDSLLRRIERVQHRDPPLRLSMFLSDVQRAAGEHANFGAVESSLVRLQDSFSDSVSKLWGTTETQVIVSDIVFAAAEAFIGATLPLAYYDAVVELADEEGFRKAIEGCSFVVEPLREDDLLSRYVVRSNIQEKPSLGPFGVVFALNVTAQASITSLRPYVSSTLFDNPLRTKLEETFTRSSKPGGQAANTCETQSNVAFFIDGAFTFAAESQDTRKAFENRQLAREKLREVELPKYNRRIAKERYEISMADSPQSLRSFPDVQPSERPYVRAVVDLMRKSLGYKGVTP